MVRAALMLSASCASALEPTGLLQATVGMHSQVSAGSDKVASLKRMEKEWQAAAKKGTRVDDSVLLTIYDTMQGILNDTEQVRLDIINSLTNFESIISDANTLMADQHATLMASTSTGGWAKVCTDLGTHATCRAGEHADCTHRDEECNDKDIVQEHCTADNPLCACQGMTSPDYNDMKLCLEQAKAWYDNYHTAPDQVPAPAPRGYFVGAMGASETQGNITKETQECTDAIPVCNDKKTECDGYQENCQLQFCAFNTECNTWCSNYATAYAEAVANFDAEVQTELTGDGSSMQKNLDECMGAKKVICFINVVANKGYKSTDTATDRGTTYDLDVDAGYNASFGAGYDYDFCLGYEPTCDNLLIPTPVAPGPEDCNTYTCKTTVAANGLPEAASWMNAYYQSTGPTCSSNINFYLDTQPESLGATC